jgi:hypothetical protein
MAANGVKPAQQTRRSNEIGGMAAASENIGEK